MYIAGVPEEAKTAQENCKKAKKVSLAAYHATHLPEVFEVRGELGCGEKTRTEEAKCEGVEVKEFERRRDLSPFE